MDLMVDTFATDGTAQCTFGIATCYKEGVCPTTLGKTFLKNFETILDFESNNIMIRESATVRHRSKRYKTCKAKAIKTTEDETLMDKALDWFIQLYYAAGYLKTPSHVWYELFVHPHAWVIQMELAAGLLAVIITMAMVAVFGL